MYNPHLGDLGLTAGPKPGTVIDSAATLGWRTLRPGEVIPSSPQPYTPAIVYKPPVANGGGISPTPYYVPNPPPTPVPVLPVRPQTPPPTPPPTTTKPDVVIPVTTTQPVIQPAIPTDQSQATQAVQANVSAPIVSTGQPVPPPGSINITTPAPVVTQAGFDISSIPVVPLALVALALLYMSSRKRR